MDALRTELLAEEILNHFKKTRVGHCARVDFLTAAEAESLCRYIALKQQKTPVAAYILARHDQALDNSVYITVDKAIELRNRKQARLCLFMPTGLVDAAYSSLANSFAIIDGRELHKHALKQVRRQLPAHAGLFVHAVFSRLRGALNVSDDQKLDFAIAVLQQVQAGEIAKAGLEFWRVNLIVDATIGEAIESAAQADLETRLEQNRRCALALAHPAKIDATTRERIQSLRVNKATADRLATFFRGRSLNDVQSWSRALISHEDLTFDRWIFPEKEDSDIRGVSIIPFVNAAGIVEKYCHLIQQDAKGSLVARCAPKEKLEVRWKCDPEQPKNLGGWRVAIVPVDSEIEYEGSIELPERDLPAKRRKTTIDMNIVFDEPPDFPVCVRVSPISSDGTVITGKDGEEIYGESQEFFLSSEISRPEIASRKESKFLVPNLAAGRLSYILESSDKTLTETEPQWSCKDLDYFSIKVNDRRLLQVGISPVLLDLERQCLSDPAKSGCFVLQVDDIHAVNSEDCVARQFSAAKEELWTNFWKTRKSFFNRLCAARPRDVIEIAEWTTELAGAALRYAQAYQDLIEDLLENHADRQALREALSVDSLLVRIAGRGGASEEAVVILPTHPLRVAWLVSYTRLLQDWEAQLLKLSSRERKYHLDLHALYSLTPINVPAFAYHIDTTTTFTFFQNLRFFHGVALPADVPDPHRRYGDVAVLLGMTVDQGAASDRHAEQLAEHLKNFRDLHPYVTALVTTLINPDRGDFFAEAIKKTLPTQIADDSEHEPLSMPAFQITAYTDSHHKSTLQAIEQIRQNIDQQLYRRPTDHFLPVLTTTSRSMTRFIKGRPPEAHIAVVTDLTRPEIKVLARDQQNEQHTTSFAFYGLVNRFVSRFSADQQALRWRHAIVTEGARRPDHAALARAGELLINLHTALLHAGGYVLGGTAESQPVLEVTLTQEQRQLLEDLHESTNWVVTLDRFFTLDYYDSPYEPDLKALARKYVLDYSPEFTDGLGHRMMVTTAWHEEIQSFLSQAMNDLGFAYVDQSVSHLLHYLKTISGRLALQALESSTTAAAAVGLGVVTAWLQQKGRLKQAVLIPVDSYPRLFSLDSSGRAPAGERRCDLVLISLRRNIVNATFIEVKWRRGQVPFEDLSRNMVLQMKNSAEVMRKRFFDEKRVDGALQRSYLANVLRFYYERSRRYELFDPKAEQTFLEHVSRLEKSGLDFRPAYEGYIVSLDGETRKPFPVDDAQITVLTAKDFAQSTIFRSRDFIPSDAGGDLAENPAYDVSDEMPAEYEYEETDEEEETIAEVAAVDGRENVSVERAASDIEQPASLAGEDEAGGEATQPLSAEQPVANGVITVPLGRAAVSNVAVDWQPAVSGSPHLFILGIPGQGKSWTVTRILTELSRQRVPALVLDFHGQFADPREPFVQAYDPLVLDAAKGLPFSPFECTQDAGSGGWLANSYAIAEIFGQVAGLGVMQRDIVFSAIRDAYRACGFSDDDNQLNEQLPLPALADVLSRIESLAQARHVSNVVARCRPLLEMNLFRPPEQRSDLLSQIRSGLVIDLHNLYVETLQQAAGAFVLRKLYKDMFRWGYAQRIRLAVVLDEAHRLARDLTLPKIMREGRKFGIAVIVASQSMTDFHPDVLGTSGSKIIFRVNYPDSKKVAGFIRGLPGTDLAARIEQLPVGSAYVQTPEMSVGSVVKMHPLR